MYGFDKEKEDCSFIGKNMHQGILEGEIITTTTTKKMEKQSSI